MKIYIGNVGSHKHHEFMRQNGWGMMHTPDWRNPVNGLCWALDNGAYSAWVNGREFDGEKFLATINKIPEDNPPDFIVLPDIIAGGKDLNNIPCHIGGVGTFKRLFWAYRIGVNSIDSSTFVQANGGRDGFRRIIDAKEAATKIEWLF